MGEPIQSETLKTEPVKIAPVKTALHDLHVELGGRVVDFAGYALPVQFAGIVAEHNHTRTSASLFDVSHMGQLTVTGPNFETTVAALETLIPADLASLKPGEMRYSVLLNDGGTIEDDLIVTRPAIGQADDGVINIVINAGRKTHDLAVFQKQLGAQLQFVLADNLALLALQGPKAATALARLCDAPHKLSFMQSAPATIAGVSTIVSRCGYTGEDGFEISVLNEHAEHIARLLLSEDEVLPAGLGARDSLRLESGLCLYGHDMDDTIDPISAGLLFSIGKQRRETGGFAGFEHVRAIREEGPTLKRVGLSFEGRMPVREGAEIVDENDAVIGSVTSGTFSPTLQHPISMAYVPRKLSKIGTQVTARVRGKPTIGVVTKMPFVPQTYKREPGL